jgi:hypothetical protein
MSHGGDYEEVSAWEQAREEHLIALGIDPSSEDPIPDELEEEARKFADSIAKRPDNWK